MRLVDADNLLEHTYRDKLDSRELIAEMINNAPTIVPPITERSLNRNDEWIERRLTISLPEEIGKILRDEQLSHEYLLKIGCAIGKAAGAVHDEVYTKNYRKIREYEEKIANKKGTIQSD